MTFGPVPWPLLLDSVQYRFEAGTEPYEEVLLTEHWVVRSSPSRIFLLKRTFLFANSRSRSSDTIKLHLPLCNILEISPLIRKWIALQAPPLWSTLCVCGGGGAVPPLRDSWQDCLVVTNILPVFSLALKLTLRTEALSQQQAFYVNSNSGSDLMQIQHLWILCAFWLG